jgi:hypothetical protein
VIFSTQLQAMTRHICSPIGFERCHVIEKAPYATYTYKITGGVVAAWRAQDADIDETRGRSTQDWG